MMTSQPGQSLLAYSNHGDHTMSHARQRTSLLIVALPLLVATGGLASCSDDNPIDDGAGGFGGTGGASTSESSTQTSTTSQGSGGSCVPGSTRDCYLGPEGTEGVGECKGGTAVCMDTGEWAPCEGAVLPAPQDCTTLDVDEACRGTHGPCEHELAYAIVARGLGEQNGFAVATDAGATPSGGSRPKRLPRSI
jgi:hypothetical protein